MHETLFAVLGALCISFIPLCLIYVYNPSNLTLNAALISLAVGSLLGDAIFHLVPEMLQIDHHAAIGPILALFVGIMLFFAFEQYLQIYHCGHGHHTEQDRHGGRREEHIGPLVIVSDLLHNLVDGLAIGVSYRSSFSTGISTTIAVLLHEIPHELSDYAILGSTGYTKSQIIIWSIVASVASVFGAIIGSLLGNLSIYGNEIQVLLLGFTAGSFMYIALADLAPELLHQHSQLGILQRNSLVLVGAMVMFFLKWFI